MSKNSFIVLILAILIIAIALFSLFYNRSHSSPTDQSETIVRDQTTAFGSALKNVSLLASTTSVRDQIQTQYSSYLTPELLSQWQSNPAIALGREVSSPYPDHIEITSVTKQNDNTYLVKGNVVEVTSADELDGIHNTYPVTLVFVNRSGTWLISSTTLSTASTSSVIYD